MTDGLLTPKTFLKSILRKRGKAFC